MIASVQGRVQAQGPDWLVIQVGGVGLRVFVPAEVAQRSHGGDEVFLHTHFVVREDNLSLYGFETGDALHLFEELLMVNGVGPRLALAVLSHLSPEAIRRAIFHEQVDLFSRVPGVGRKTAQKILLTLQDRIKPGLESLGSLGAITDLDTDVIAALTALGYSVVESQAAIQAIPRDAPKDVETRLRLALQQLSR